VPLLCLFSNVLSLRSDFEATFSAQQAAEWLLTVGFEAKSLEAFSGQDLLGASKDDLKELMGTANGIRLYNRLHTLQSQTQGWYPLPLAPCPLMA
jgi:hypothetical protein